VAPLSVLLLYALSPGNRTLSYQRGWPREFARHPRFRVTGVDVAGSPVAVGGRLTALALTRRFDAMVMLHSVFSNERQLHWWAFDAAARVPAPKVFFIGNEYKLMPEKMAFAEECGIALLVSQSESPRVHDLYRRRLQCEVMGLPNTGLDPNLFFPRGPRAERPIDVGYRSLKAPLYLGHEEKSEIARRWAEAAARHGLVADISINPRDRFTEEGWADFLGRCKAQLGTEAGGDYFEIDDRTRIRFHAWIEDHPEHTLAEVREALFRDYPDPVPIRIVSGRQIEAAGTKTVQVLMRGQYGGYFAPDVHYIPLEKDFSNLDETAARLRDHALCDRLADSAYALAHERLTYAKLLDRFADRLAVLV
jgi:hypothetical protein